MPTFPEWLTLECVKDWYKRKSIFLFIFFQFFTSVVTHLDLATNSLFLAKVLATNNCQVRRESGFHNALHDIEHFWHQMWETPFSSFWHISPPKFSHCVLFVWASLFGQVLYSMSYSVPVSTNTDPWRRCTSADGVKALFGAGPEANFYEVRDRDLGSRRYGLQTYPTLWMRRAQHGTALMALAESARMYTICSNTGTDKEEMVKRGLRRSGQVFQDIVVSIFSF